MRKQYKAYPSGSGSAHPSSTPVSAPTPSQMVVTNTLSVPDHPACLQDNEVADYTLYDGKYNGTSTLTVHVRNSNSGTQLREFTKTIIRTKHYHPVELHRCYAYYMTQFNYDSVHHRSLPGYTAVLWRSDYEGRGERIVLLGENPVGGLAQYFTAYFSSDFRVSPNERYVSLADMQAPPPTL
jgi:hypothetical protein